MKKFIRIINLIIIKYLPIIPLLILLFFTNQNKEIDALFLLLKE